MVLHVLYSPLQESSVIYYHWLQFNLKTNTVFAIQCTMHIQKDTGSPSSAMNGTYHTQEIYSKYQNKRTKQF